VTEKFKFSGMVIDNKIVGPVHYRHFQHIYTLEPGDKWCLIEGYVLIANQDKIPFTIDLKTGERKSLFDGEDALI
jgi:hypothetical protein